MINIIKLPLKAVHGAKRWFAGLSAREKVFAAPILLLVAAPVIFYVGREAWWTYLWLYYSPPRVKFFAASVIGTLFYGLWAGKVFNFSTRGWPWQARLHHLWLNLAGAATGWLALYYLYFLRLGEITVGRDFGGTEVLLAVVSFVGITGYLPYFTIGLLEWLRLLGLRVIDALKLPR